MVKLTDLIIKGNQVTMLCKKYNIRWKMNLAGVTVYRSKYDTEGVWFPLASVDKAIPLIMEMANVNSTSQSSLDQWR